MNVERFLNNQRIEGDFPSLFVKNKALQSVVREKLWKKQQKPVEKRKII